MSGQRIGIFGGTFDPIHVGHLFVAEAVFDAAQLSTVLFVPVGSPAHRHTHASAADRRAMTELAIAGNSRFAFDSTGLEQQAPAYTADTLALLRKKHPEARFVFIAGIDSLVRSAWRRLDEVADQLERFVIVSREGTNRSDLDPTLRDLPAELRARFDVVDVPLIDVSSTTIRELVAAGRSIRYLVPDAVREYIAARALYK